MSKRRSLSGSILYLALISFIVTGFAFWAFKASLSSSLAELENGANQRLDLYAATLDSEMERFARLPGVLGLSPAVVGLLHTPRDPELQRQVNRYLEHLTERTGATAIYIMNNQGQVLATSNWQQPDSFLGENDAFRPYFKEAIIGKSSHFFGIGTTRNEPGYYLSQALDDDGNAIGVAVVKISLAHLEHTWSQNKALVWVADANRVVILASRPEWKFATLGSLSSADLRKFDETRQYNRFKLKPLKIDELHRQSSDAREVRWQAPPGVADSALHRYLEQTRPLAGSNWQLSVLISLAPAYSLAYSRAGLAAVLTILILTGLVLLNERRRRLRDKLAAREALHRAYLQLEQKVEERTSDLLAANCQLKEEVAERTRAEAHLRQTQAELIQAGKMAVVGQLSAQIAHELNQPLAALSTLSANTVKYLARGNLATASGNLETIGQLVERMGRITGALRSFAHKSQTSSGQSALTHTLDNALFLVDQRLRHGAIEVRREEAPGLLADCDPNRLEQVLVNLLTNALDALQDQPGALIVIRSRQDGNRVELTLHDNGHGFSAKSLQHLFEPFYTTKPAGVGLGLGLALSASIVAEAGGTLTAANHPHGGAIFTLTLPAHSGEPVHV
ncbi:sensor histidine kinase [Paludibacterium purpuratum]|uniref:C4-dicarboxylate transport sensor protein DctB n=1 Tax=Paludibacterium purpuratum TaxID=1144873 RepID=A0A4R7B199_9NEIS|nr:ATP-binding protein [Paludibacterium purpuratum]TDR73261.1 two-component system C4-dicarboxylate transport sensor histidine kinase DctB [Paludibacterium purpuratum]